MDNNTENSRWSADGSRKIIYRVVAEGTLTLKTPAHFGNGDKIINIKEGEQANKLELYKDPHNNSPLLPGASIAGGLRHYLTQRTLGYRTSDEDKTSVMKTLFGEALDEDRGNQSRLIIHDAYSNDKRLPITRDGVKIDGKTRTASHGALYQIKMWDIGTQFPLRLELVLYKDDDLEKYKQAFATLLKALQHGEIPMGARKNRGYGQCVVDNWAVYEYDLANIDHFLLWVKGDLPDANPQFIDDNASYIDKRRRVTLSATFALCDSLMIRKKIDRVDAKGEKKELTQHLTDAFNNPLLTGTSIAGALRARAEKILNTVGKDISIVQKMFGEHDEDNDNNRHASRLIVKEATIENGNMNFIQNRVKIDRFTGGAYDSALINQQPVFAQDNTRVTIELELRNPEPHEIGLLLLLLKDLSTEDLPLGGESSIGRGRLKGLYATLCIKDKEDNDFARFEFSETGLAKQTDVTKLQAYVDDLWGYDEKA